MRYLKTYEFFNFFKRKKKKEDEVSMETIIHVCEDILLELEDMGYETRVTIDPITFKASTSSIEFLIICDAKLPYFPTEVEADLDYYTKKALYETEFQNIWYKDIKPVYDRIKEYLNKHGIEGSSNRSRSGGRGQYYIPYYNPNTTHIRNKFYYYFNFA